jgi:release factor glutamine methyltransferase
MTTVLQHRLPALALVHQVADELAPSGVPSPRVDAELLVADALGLSRSELYSTDVEPAAEELVRLRASVTRRQRREPLAYILGTWGFRRLTLAVDGRALIPRPETEIVVERCLVHLRDRLRPEVVDVGTGSGAIALAIADEHPGARVLAIDRSDAALALAAENVARTGLGERVGLRYADLLDRAGGPFDLVVSNPPYVPPEELESLQDEIRLYEPREAVIGVGIAERLAADARQVLRPGGWLVLECGDGQASGLAAELRRLGYADVLATPDLAGRDRVVEGRLPR